MLKSYIKIAWRNILRNPFHSFINLFGLSLGISFTLLIGAYIWSELQVNRQLNHPGNQYIIQSKWKDPNMGFDLATLGPLGKTLKEEYPQLVANYYRFDGITSTVSTNNNYFREGIQIGDSTVLEMYGFLLAQGDRRTAFSDPFSVVITEAKALKYFGRTDVVGESLTIESFSGSKKDFKITGVLKQPDRNSITRLNGDNDNQILLAPGAFSFFNRNIETWNNPYVANFIELKEGIEPKDLEQPIRELIRKHAPVSIANNIQPYLVPLTRYYLDANNGLVRKMLMTISGIAIFILLMAIINFVNISVSKSSARIREIGVRKVMGGLKNQLIIQFLLESVVLVTLAMILSLVLFQIGRPLLSDILGNPIPGLHEFPLVFLVVPPCLILVIGVLSGIYPALILSSFKPVDSIKGKFKTVKENVWLRKSLVGFQFATAIIVFSGTGIITRQVALFFSKNLGYDKEYMITAQLPRDWSKTGVQKMETVRDEIAKMPEVSGATLSFEIPNGANEGSVQIYDEAKDSTQAVASQLLSADGQYASVYRIPMVAGNFFSPVFQPSDTLKVVVNEATTRAMGYSKPEDAIGKKVKLQGGGNSFEIMGVTTNYHFGSMQQEIQPCTFLHVQLSTIYRYLSIKLKKGDMEAALNGLQKKWATLLPGAAFEYTFLDDTLKKLYQSEIQLKKASYLSSILAIVIVLLGVMGLISLTILKRAKEIGIRKVLGASGGSIVLLFLKEFMSIAIVSGLISIPFAWYIMSGWLHEYVYRISLTAQPFILALIILGTATGLLILFQIIKAMADNPIKNLKTE